MAASFYASAFSNIPPGDEHFSSLPNAHLHYPAGSLFDPALSVAEESVSVGGYNGNQLFADHGKFTLF